MKLKYIPNILSSIRLVLVIAFAIVFLNGYLIAAVIIFLVAGATDIVDGYLARRNNWISDVGKILDPLADKSMQCTALVCLCLAGFIPVWLIIPFVVKEIVQLIFGFLMLKRRSVVVVSSWFGKLAVCVFYAAIVALIAMHDNVLADPANAFITYIIGSVALAFTLFAFVMYFRKYIHDHGNGNSKAKTGDTVSGE